MISRLDVFGVALLIGLAAALLGGGVILVDTGVIKEWEFLTIISVGVVLVAASQPRAPPAMPHNSMVHGSARPAAESEAHAAARGDIKSAPLHDATFPD
jgi:hypothetical protein